MTIAMWLWVVAAALFLVGAWAWLYRTRGPAKLLLRTLGTVLLLAALGLAGLGGLLRQYAWLLEDVPAATISLRGVGPQRFEATLRLGDTPARTLEVAGDEWQLDARVIRWTLPAQLGGLAPVYRFERLSGRYTDPAQELSSERSVHDLREDWDFWEFRQRWLADLPIAEARWGSAAYLPMIDGATYQVYVSPRGGLVAKPADTATARLLDEAGW
ncbi:MAG: hypothetical protein K0M70_01055 [Arenimonas sp.]|uniref:hypothetical protein n=1 Tax=Arenimonas sp. TaxID=1872635 RepID=UPI0025BC4E9E|nr:hypothetical protein [Arenimonas sp.]MBW8366435.1 hypothetical protein [Arenimonas sp.]